jgi:hypothetical protein
MLFFGEFNLRALGSGVNDLNLIVACAADNLERVRKQISSRVERFDGAARAAREIYDEAASANASDGTGQDGARSLFPAFFAHQFRDSRQEFLASLHGGFGSGISWADSRATRRQNQIRSAVISE